MPLNCSQPGHKRHRHGRDALVLLAILLATVAVYWQVGRHEFLCYDDNGYVTDNPAVLGGLSLDGAKWAFTTGHEANWHPLTWLSHMLDVTLFGLDAGAHLYVNLAIHAANTALLFFVLRRMTGRPWPSAWVAAAFALHPLHVESVAWVTERKDVLSTLFGLLALLAYARYVERPRLWRYLPVALAFGLSLLSKPMLVTLPFAMLLLDLWPLGRLPWARPGARLGVDRPPPAPRPSLALVLGEKVPLLLMSATSSVVTFLVQDRYGAVAGREALGLAPRVANAAVSYVRYLDKTFRPVGLAAPYPHPGQWPLWQPVAAAALLVLISAAVVWASRRRPYLLVGWLWYLGTLVPAIGLVQVGWAAMADRYAYVPLVGVFVAVAWFADDLPARRGAGRVALAVAATALLAACAVLTWRQAGFWRDTAALFRHTLAVTRDNAIAHNNLGFALARAGRQHDAVAEFRRCLAIRPFHASAHNNLGASLAHQGRTEDALVCYRAAVEINPDYNHARNNLGVTLVRLGRIDEGIAQFREALRRRPRDAQALHNLGWAMARRGNLDDAIRYYRAATEARPRFAEAHNELGVALAVKGRLDEAVAEYEKAIRADPGLARAHNNLAMTLLQMSRPDEALRHYREAIRLEPHVAEYHYNLGCALAARADYDGAARQFRRAIETDPDHARAHSNLGVALIKLGRPGEAAACFHEAVRLDPDYAEAHNNLAFLLQAAGQTDDALAHYRNAIRLRPDYLKAHENLARLLDSLGRDDEAREVRARIREIQADSPGRGPAPDPPAGR